MSRTVIADLPPMTNADLARFEKEGGIWGTQRAIRRQQVSIAWKVTGLTTLLGAMYVKSVRHNTWYVVVGTAPVFAMLGFACGHAVGTAAVPSVANNKETTMMKRVWWAKECSKNWTASQTSEAAGVWKAEASN
mmetsp:Transcript_17352/g.19784  ORF Transcript_17352/g.19784 Transcript_17352/m.19784 type:complete len:134 (-) Transcript_17352:290-691(-)